MFHIKRISSNSHQRLDLQKIIVPTPTVLRILINFFQVTVLIVINSFLV